MNVKEAYDTLGKLITEGHGDVILMCSDDQGNTEEGGVSSSISEVDGTETGGQILDMEVGTKYAQLWFG